MDVLLARPEPLRCLTRRDRRAERRRLARCDALSSRLAELHSIRGLLEGAGRLVQRGWVQNGWFSVTTPTGPRVLTAYDLRLLRDAPVTGACLIGAIVHEAGGPATVRTQLVQRTLDLTWHTLSEDLEPPRLLCPSPQVRTMRVQDLTRWNDAPGRTRDQVVELLVETRRFAGRLGDACRTERSVLLDEQTERVPRRVGEHVEGFTVVP